MKLIFALGMIVLSLTFVFGQNEQSPMVEKEFDYKDWAYPNVQTGRDMNLRKFVNGKKLVMVVYWAPWCHNWQHDLGFVQELYEKYKGNGLDVIGVAEYDPVSKMKEHIAANKLTFPSVYESASSSAREKTEHFKLRREAGDTRKWGSPWYVFLEGDKLEPAGLVLSKKPRVVNGELIRDEAEKFIRAKLGLPAEAAKSVVSANTKIEVCDPDKNNAFLRP